MFPQESARSRSDPLARKLGYLALAWAALMLLLYGGYALALSSGVSAIQKIAAQG
jgi:type VI protein secretion system component VasF